MRCRLLIAGATLVTALAAALARPASTPAAGLGVVCKVAGLVSGVAGRACTAVQDSRRIIDAGGQLLRGHLGDALKTVTNDGAASGDPGRAAVTARIVGVAAVAAGGAAFALREAGRLVSRSTRPRLAAPWFSRVYWQVAAMALLLTLPFLCAAAIQAVLQSDLALLLRAAFGYLPLAMLGVFVAAQATSLLLSLTDGLCGLVTAAGGTPGPGFLLGAGAAVGALTVKSNSLFLVLLVAVFTMTGAIVLLVEMLVREAAVYVIVVLLPLAFASFVWPARRVWALRAVELLVALILSKLAIITVLTLGAAALMHLPGTGYLAGLVLLVLAVFAPWAMLRLVPMAELAGGVAAGLRGEARRAGAHGGTALGVAASGTEWAAATVARMRREAEQGAETTRPHALMAGSASDEGDQADAADPDALGERVRVTAPPNPDALGEPVHGSGPADPDAGAEPMSRADPRGEPDSPAGGADGHARAAPSTPAAPPDAPATDTAGEPVHVGEDPASRRRGELPPILAADSNTWRSPLLGLGEGWPPAIELEPGRGGAATTDEPASGGHVPP